MTMSSGQALLLQVAGDVGELRQLARAARTSSRHPGVELGGIGVLEHELVGRAADRGVDGQVLHRLHVERDADDAGDLLLQPADDLRWRSALRSSCGFRLIRKRPVLSVCWCRRRR